MFFPILPIQCSHTILKLIKYTYISPLFICKGYESNFNSYGQDVIQHLGASYDYGKTFLTKSHHLIVIQRMKANDFSTF